jgi:hypothetical protein
MSVADFRFEDLALIAVANAGKLGEIEQYVSIDR